MTAVNHALTGTAIGLISGVPAVALPLALVSHYICDMIPHFGTRNPEMAIKSRAFRNYLFVEASLCFVIVLALAILQPVHWLLAAVCAFVAASPDLLSINYFQKMKKGAKWRPGAYVRFAKKIQWFEKPIGAVVEVVWLVAVCLVIYPFL